MATLPGGWPFEIEDDSRRNNPTSSSSSRSSPHWIPPIATHIALRRVTSIEALLRGVEMKTSNIFPRRRAWVGVQVGYRNLNRQFPSTGWLASKNLPRGNGDLIKHATLPSSFPDTRDQGCFPAGSGARDCAFRPVIFVGQVFLRLARSCSALRVAFRPGSCVPIVGWADCRQTCRGGMPATQTVG
jgi:hypothetical protein